MGSIDKKSSISSFFNDIRFRKKIYKSFKAKYEPFVAFDFNVFDFIRPDENGISNIIRHILDPCGAHGQGDVFLRQFLEIENIAEYPKQTDNLEETTITCEEPTTLIESSKRRIDITINFNNFGIGIENKPWAGEQEEQLQDYHEQMNKNYGTNYQIIFLTQDGREPKSLDKNICNELSKNNKLLLFRYQHQIKSWLETCQEKCRSEKVRFFLQDFINYIETHLKVEEDQENEQGE